MKIAFTICTNSYLAQARVLGDCIQRTNPDWSFFIILADRKIAGIDYDGTCCERVIEIEAVPICGLNEMTSAYNVVELSTSVKPSLFRYFFEDFPQAEAVMYLDPDIMVFGKFEAILDEAGPVEIALTPHVVSPIPLDGFEPQENQFLNHGSFNLGFLLLQRGANTKAMLSWWEERLRRHCVIDLTNGYFVDQLWMNLVPIYFRSVAVLRNPGLNLAYWNFHERRVSARSRSEDGFMVNGSHPLIFMHFSSYSPRQPDRFCWRGLTRFTFQDRPDLQPLFELYQQLLVKWQYSTLNSVVPYFEEQRQARFNLQRSSAKQRVLNKVRATVPESLVRGLRSFLRG